MRADREREWGRAKREKGAKRGRKKRKEGWTWKVGRKGKKNGREEAIRSKEPIVWQGPLVKLENKLQRTGQDGGPSGMEKLEYDFTLFLRLIATSIRFNQEEFNSRKEKWITYLLE